MGVVWCGRQDAAVLKQPLQQALLVQQTGVEGDEDGLLGGGGGVV